ncbi:GNAT family N-acetyltransferase [Rhodococcus sp. 15-649-2-2]|uniref:GNAT family N-acetyltransferase n=1 Tax=Rhodococcus sp. 15-649-2-2 TaxID=2023140 RepID=UPI001C53353A|nr:GNAT family N-acetyltransferase [Rhodococcus sp. 15-649-2-2]
MGDIEIRLARSDENETVSALALRSKAYWGYSEDFLQACRVELTYDSAVCGSGRMWVAVVGSSEPESPVVGFSLLGGEAPAGELTALFVDASSIGTGCGRKLLEHTISEARAQGFERLTLDADPGAESFYLHFGAVRIGTAVSGSIPGRELPRLEIVL